MELKTILLTIGGILILAISLDAMYRFWQERHHRLRLRLEPVPEVDTDLLATELVGPVREIPRSVAQTVEEGALETPVEEQDLFVQQDMFADTVVPIRDTDQLEPDDPTLRQEDLTSAESAIEDYIILHVLPTVTEAFSGEMLLRSVLGYGLRMGDRGIFHRHEHPSGRGEILFSMANAVEPGYFDLEQLHVGECYGVTFFQQLPGIRSIQSYELMLDTARRLAQDVGGEVLDAHHMPLSVQLAEHLRQKVQEFERQKLMTRVENP